MAWLASHDRIFEPSRVRVRFLIIAALAYGVTELGRFVGRPYVRAHGLHDFGLTDSIGNLGGIVVQIFFALAIINPIRVQSYRLAAFFAAGYVLYEFAQPYLPRGTFDWHDIWATVIGYGLAVLILRAVWRGLPASDRSASPDR